MTEWHEDEEFWELLGPVMFKEERRVQAEQDVPQMIKLMGVDPKARILDMACGNGRYAIALAEKGYRVTAVDPIASYLEDGRERAIAKERSLEVEFIKGDMRTFHREEGFDAVIVMGTSFGIFGTETEERESVRNMGGSLVPGGKLVLEIVGEGAGRSDRPNTYEYEAEGMRCIESHTPRGDGTWVDSHLLVQFESGEREYSYSYHVYTPKSMTELLSSCGFCDIRFYSDLAGTPYDSTSLKLLVVGTKKK